MVTSIGDFKMPLAGLKTQIQDILKTPPEKFSKPQPRTLDQQMYMYSMASKNIILADTNSAMGDRAECTIREVIKGDVNLRGTTITVNKPSPDDMEEYSFDFVRGEKVLLFLRTTDEHEYEVIPGPHGKFVIDGENNAVSIGGFKTSLEDLKVKIQDILKTSAIK